MPLASKSDGLYSQWLFAFRGGPVKRGLVGTVVVDGPAPSAPVAGLDHRWLALRLDGRRAVASPRALVTSPRAAALVAGLDLDELAGEASPSQLALAVVLPCWTLLGMLDRAMVLTRAYVREREQFGQPLSRFQSVQFQLTEAEVERCGVEELACYALWSLEAGRDEVLADALVLRLAALEAAEVVLRITHQLHGAIGFCDEAQLSWLSRYSQPLRRLPTGPAATAAALTAAVGRAGVSGLFTGETADRSGRAQR